MKTLQITLRTLLAAPLALGLPFAAIHAAPQYSISDLGTLGGTYSSGIALNEAGQVAGYSHLPGNAALHPFLWQEGTLPQDLNTLGGTHALVSGINNQGQVVGNAQITGDSAGHGFVWSAGAMLRLPTLGGTRGRATAINDNGVVTGSTSLLNNTVEHGVVWLSSTAKSPLDLGTLGGANSQGSDINFNGQIVGYAENASRLTHATLWAPPYNTPALDLGTLGGSYSEASAINGLGQVTGISSNTGDTQFRGFVWQAGQGMEDLGALTATSTHTAGIDINANGDVVGYSTTAGGAAKRAIVRKAGIALADLNGLILPNTGWVLSEAHAINDAGQIVGIGSLTKVDTVNNINRVESHAFLLTPDTEKPTISCPATVTTTGAQPAGIGTAVATDNLDPAPVVTNNRPAIFPGGTTTVVWTATDASDNKATCNQLVTLNSADKTPPLVSFQITPAAPSASGWYLTAPSVVWTVTDPESAISSKVGCTNVASVANTSTAGLTYSCTATSAGGATGPVNTPTIKVDNTLPTLANVPAAFTQAATSLTGAVVSYTVPTAADAFSGINMAGTATGVICAPVSGSAFPMGSTTVNCSVKDNAGNSNSANFVVTVADTTPPTIACPAAVNVVQGQAVTLGNASASDNIGVTALTNNAPASYPIGTTTVTWTAADAAGNLASCAQPVTVSSAPTPPPTTSETISVAKAQCKRINATSGEWSVQGATSLTTNNSIQLYSTATVPADLTSYKLGAAIVNSKGQWQFQTKSGPACSSPISLRSAAGKVLGNIAVAIQ
ncbi:HYR domain-containing protein [Methylomonas sp. LL1]|uniref:HYR domain-containing protein n=1 Tax=Methylomonas sp. LL1 TaxID=2785785 RepID=UPI0018C431C3|nr:HYR domain-containing protein [Methylomonas sp. LL1]QPK63378.1 HYR domain-containing protein [Methylomonas sp. LL1]